MTSPVLTITSTRPDGLLPSLPPRQAADVVLLVDESVAAIAAAAWAARLARQASSSVRIVVLLPKSSSRADAASVLGRVLPTLQRSGRPYGTPVCVIVDGAPGGRRVARTARRVLRHVPEDAGALVCPGGTGGAADELCRLLAAERPVDVLIVPDLTSLADAGAHGTRAARADRGPTGTGPAEPCDRTPRSAGTPEL